MLNTALNYIYYVYDKFIVFIFDTCDLGGGVTLGWIFIAVFVFNILMSNVLSVPRRTSVTVSIKEARSNE